MPRQAEILFKDRRTGVLTEDAAGGTRFVYDEGWTESIACTLPAGERVHVWRAGLHPFFQHLGPEGWLREKQARTGRVEEEDDLGLLLRYGRDCIGAVGVRNMEPQGAPALPYADAETAAAAGSNRTVSGVQKKLLVHRAADGFRPAEADGPATHIAKFNHETNPTLVRNEALTLRFARDVLGPDRVTAFELDFVEEIDIFALVVTRFDRTGTGEKLRLEDFAQVLNKPRGPDFRGKYESSYEAVAEAIEIHSARPPIDLDRYFRLVVFNTLVGNADAHLKNFSLLETRQGLRLAPAYDLLNTLMYGRDYDGRTALAIRGDKVPLDRVDRALLTAFGTAIGLPEQAVELALGDIARRVRRSRVLVPPAGEDPGGFVHRYTDIVHAQALRILDP